MEIKDLVFLINNFIAGDYAIKLVNEIEVGLGDEFPDDDFMQETVEMLACYRPEGGEWLLGPDTVKSRLSEVLKRIELA